MTSSKPGTSTSDVEVLAVDAHGLWLFVRGAEYFLPHEEYPWFREARIADVLAVELLHEEHLYWPSLDVNLSLDALNDPEGYPLVYR
jgi:hypothetical protein